MSKRSAIYRFELWQDGMVVAGVDAADLDDAMTEIMHYAKVYSQDGPVEIRGTNKGTRTAIQMRRLMKSTWASSWLKPA